MLSQYAALLLLPMLAMSSKPQARDETGIQVSNPMAGDTVSLGLEAAHTSINISWSTPDEIAARPVFLSLVQGNNISSLSHVATINSSAVNNGTFTWYGDNSPGGCGSPLTYTCYPAPSGCNYSVELKIWDEVAYSGYFTIINPEDEGIAPNAVCPPAGAGFAPANETFSTSASTTSAAASSATRSSTATSEATQTASAAAASSSSNGISKTTLGVAIAIPIAAVLCFILWLGRRKGWLFKKSTGVDRSAPYPELEGNSAIAVRSDGYKGVADSDYSSGFSGVPHELHGEPRAYESAGQEVHYSGGQEVHQLYGDEGKTYHGRS